MNIVKLQRQLQNVPDNALIGYVQNPDGQVPSYLALSELNRRKQMRADYQQQATPEKSVAEAMVEESQPGVASLPINDQMFTAPETGIMAPAAQQMPQQMAQAPQQMPVQSMAQGGEVKRFDGLTGSHVGYPISAPGLSEDDIAYQEALNNSELGNAVTSAYDMLPNFTNPIYKGLGYGIDTLSGLGWTTDPTTGKLIRRKDLPKAPDTTQADFKSRLNAGRKERQEYLNANPNISPAYTAKKENQADLDRQQKTAAFLKADAEKQIQAAEAKKAQDAQIQAAIDASVKPSGINTLTSSKRTARGPVAGEVPAYNKVTAATIPDFAADFAAMQKPDINVQDQIKAYRESLGDDKGLAALKDRITGMESKAAKAEEEAPWMALTKAGLAMAAGPSRFALQNIAQGAMEGLKDYNATKDKLAAAEEKRFDLASRLAQAERAEQVAAAKFGWDSKEHRDAQNQATKLAGLTHKASVAASNVTNQLNADSANAKNALDAQQNAWTHQYQMGSLDVQRSSAARMSDYETYLQEARKDKRNWSMVDGKPVFDITKVTSGYRGYDTKEDITSQNNYQKYLTANGLTTKAYPYTQYVQDMGGSAYPGFSPIVRKPN